MKKKSAEDFISIKSIFFLIYSNWYWFLLSISLSLLISILINRYSVEKYSNSTTIQIKYQSDNLLPFSEFLQDGTNNYSQSFNDEILKLKSYPIVYKTVQSLNLNIQYFIEGDIKTSETYDWKPIEFKPYNLNDSYGLSFSVNVIDKYRFSLKSDFIESKEYLFDEKIFFNSGFFTISLNQDFNIDNGIIPVTRVKFNNPHVTTKKYLSLIKTKPIEKGASVLEISIIGEDFKKETAFLNELTKTYINNNLEVKNSVSEQTIKFIDYQIQEIRDTLDLLESKLQIFKTENSISISSNEAKDYYKEIQDLQQQKSKIIIEQKYFNYLLSYLDNNTDYIDIIVPISYGINNEVLTDLTKRLTNFQLERNLLASQNNIIAKNLQDKINELKISIKNSIANSLNANEIVLNDINTRLSISQDLLKSLPSVEREMVNINRHYNLSENIYLYLLQKRAEYGILGASNSSDAKVIEPAILQSGFLISPNRDKITLICLVIGFLLPVIIINSIIFFNDKILTIDDVIKHSNIPFLGSIAKNENSNDLIVNAKPKSSITESFRSIRSNIEFLISRKSECKTILFTSSISGEGKTFCAKNMATIYAMAGKRSVLIGADLRKPKMYLTFTDENEFGLSSYLIGKSTYNDVIEESDIDNLYFIKSGPPPPNPAELLDREEMNHLIEKLKKDFDYILIDTPPVCLVSDPISLMEKVDLNIYIIRQNYTHSNYLNYVNDLHESKKIKNLSILLNSTTFDLGFGLSYYNYHAYDYGYNYANNSSYYSES